MKVVGLSHENLTTSVVGIGSGLTQIAPDGK
jgi:hypothetical protein